MTDSPLRRTGKWLARPVLLHWLLPYLMLLVAVGTVAQKYIGLYDAQRMFFSSFLFWWGMVPLPGGRAVVALMLVSLLAKLVIGSPWRKATAGIFVAHLGVLLLLLGGLLTAAFSTEGYVVLARNDTATGFFDYHRRELTLSKNGHPVLTVPEAHITKGAIIPALAFTLTITDACHNCTMAARGDAAANLQGLAQKVKLAPVANYLEDERNLSGAEIVLSGAGEADGAYLLFEPMEHWPGFALGTDSYSLMLGRAAYALPFSLTLLDFGKEVHPGTEMARGYRSTVLLTDGDIRQRAVITMNHPLRYKGYTVYQSSFNESGEANRTVSFAVVENSGRVFPYVASMTLCLGLIIHLCFRLPSVFRRGAHAV